MSEFKAACIAALALSAALVTAVFATGSTFGQRCVTESLPEESRNACVQRLKRGTDCKEQ